MNFFKIALRSIQHRGFGSLLTIISMALGVMLVVSVLTIHGLIADSFRSNSSFGYDMIVGARGGGLQLTLNTVYYLSQPVENIPYEYYLAFCDQPTRERELVQSISYHAFYHELDCMHLAAMSSTDGAAGPGALASLIQRQFRIDQQRHTTGIDRRGLYKLYTSMAVPLCLGDSWEVPGSNAYFRCVGTKPEFFEKLVLDMETEAKFEFAEGRCFEEYSDENGFYECVIGALVAKRGGLKLGDTIMPTHGDPNSTNSHIHQTPFTVVGILKGTRSPHDRALFLNMNGFYLMDGHVKPVNEEAMLKGETGEDDGIDPNWNPEDMWDDPEDPIPEMPFDASIDADAGNPEGASDPDANRAADNGDGDSDAKPSSPSNEAEANEPEIDPTIPLPIEQREVTSILVLTDQNDPTLSFFLPAQINEGDLESTLNWSNFRPVRAQKAAQAVNPVEQVTGFFYMIVDPIRWLLLALTIMICIVSGISILVGIYNSMNQRRHEIAVMRALGASRGNVMLIMLTEAFLLALAGGILGWVAGHGLNAALGPIVEAQTGVGIGFFDIAPPVPVFAFLGDYGSFLPNALLEWRVSPELLLLPGLLVLAVLVGVYPAISAYRTDVAKSLGK